MVASGISWRAVWSAITKSPTPLRVEPLYSTEGPTARGWPQQYDFVNTYTKSRRGATSCYREVLPAWRIKTGRRSKAGLRPLIAGRRWAPERTAKPKLAEPPVVVLHPVDQSHRDQVSIRSAQRGVIKDRAFHPLDTQVPGHALDHFAHRFAEVTAGFGDEGDPRRGWVAHDPTL